MCIFQIAENQIVILKKKVNGNIWHNNTNEQSINHVDQNIHSKVIRNDIKIRCFENINFSITSNSKPTI